MPAAKPRAKKPVTKRAAKPASRAKAASSGKSKPATRTNAGRRATKPASVAARTDDAQVTALLATIARPERRDDLERLHALIRKTLPSLATDITSGMVGYGRYRYRYPSGREGDTSVIAWSSRASYISLYVCAADAKGFIAERYRERLPGADIGKSCVRFARLDDLDLGALRDLLREGARSPMAAVTEPATSGPRGRSR